MSKRNFEKEIQVVRQVEQQLKKPNAPIRPQDFEYLTKTDTIGLISTFITKLIEAQERNVSENPPH